MWVVGRLSLLARQRARTAASDVRASPAPEIPVPQASAAVAEPAIVEVESAAPFAAYRDVAPSPIETPTIRGAAADLESVTSPTPFVATLEEDAPFAQETADAASTSQNHSTSDEAVRVETAAAVSGVGTTDDTEPEASSIGAVAETRDSHRVALVSLPQVPPPAVPAIETPVPDVVVSSPMLAGVSASSVRGGEPKPRPVSSVDQTQVASRIMPAPAAEAPSFWRRVVTRVRKFVTQLFS